MWSLKFLSGPKAGKEVLLQEGLILLGRAEDCAVNILANGISKKHAQIHIKKDTLKLEDLNSRNGTFIDGKQIKTAVLKEGDRFALNDIILEVKKRSPSVPAFMTGFDQNAVSNLGMPYPSPDSKPAPAEKKSLFENIYKSIRQSINESLLPGIYQLAEWMEFKIVVAGFVTLFAILVISLSAFPMISILKTSAEQESLNNAETIAETIAQSNASSLKKGLASALSVDYALRRPGVEKAYIISAIDGRIMAPAELAHTYPKNPFIHKARKKDIKSIDKVGSSSIIAVVPVSFYNPETGANKPHAYSVVIYTMDTLFSGTAKVASLLVQTFLIASFLGLILFFFLINLVEFPLRSLNLQLGKTLKKDRVGSVSLNYQSQVLQDLCSHINSALNQISLGKMLQSQQDQLESSSSSPGRDAEMSNLVDIIGFPALAVSMEDKSVSAVNSNLTEQLDVQNILHQPLETLEEATLKDHLLELISQTETNPQEIAFGEITINQISLQSTCQLIMGEDSPAYAIITFMPMESEEVA